MRKKISTGLVATNGDGKPTVRPPIPTGWCNTASSTFIGADIEELKSVAGNNHLQENMSSDNSRAPSPHNTPSMNGTSNAMSEPINITNTDLDNSADDGNSNVIEHSEPLCEISPLVGNVPQPLPSINNPNPAMSEDSNVDVETEEQGTPVNSNVHEIEPDEAASNTEVVSRQAGGQDRDEQDDEEDEDDDDDSEMSDSQYIEKQVVESFLNVTSSELHAIGSKNVTGLTKSINSSSSNENSFYKSSSQNEKVLPSVGDNLKMSNLNVINKSEKILDAVSMTIASVAAGEGGPPEFLNRNPSDRHHEDIATFQHNQALANKHRKSKNERNISASARLPVISSLLAPSNSASHMGTLPGIHHIASHGKISSSPTTVLPSVAHFLGPAKSPPTAYPSRQSNNIDMYGTPTTSASSDTNDSGQLSGHFQSPAGGHLSLGTPQILSSTKSKNSRKPVTPAGLRLSMAASEELPDPLPVPQYSDKVIRAKQLGTVAFDRPTVLRETVQFFLQFKHYWSSHDYDRISNLVIELFPEFKDNSETPGVPANKRIRTDLSMYARNFRRREVSQRKKESGSLTPNSLDPRTENSTVSSHETSARSFSNSSLPPSSNGGAATSSSANNPSDFCNELLTAASIIESQNTASANRNRELNNQIPIHHHKVRITEPISHSQGVVIHKQEVMEHDDARRDTSGSHQKLRGETLEDDDDDTPIHFVYDKDTMAATASRDTNTAWQMYSEQMAQAMAATGGSSLDYGISEQAIKKDLGTCARNMRRRLPIAKFKLTPSPPKSWNNAQSAVDTQQMSEVVNATNAPIMPGSAEYMKALIAAQNINLTELGMTQRNLGELALLASIKQRLEQYPQEVSDLERQYLAQCSSEEQRQALMASGAFGNDTAAMAALSAFYGLGMDIANSKRGLGSSDYNNVPTHDASFTSGEVDVPNKRQRRVSQAEVEKRLREAELSHNNSHQEEKSHGLSVATSSTHMVKREPMSPSEGKKTTNKQHPQQLTIPMPVYSSANVSSAHDAVYWDAQAATSAALSSISRSGSQQTATQAHSQAHVHHLPGHDHTAHPTSTEAPMNLTYHESDKHISQRMSTDSPIPESLPDTAGLAAQVEVTTSSVKSHSPRRRASSSPRSSHQGDQSLSSRDQVWFPHGAGFKKENQEVVCLPDPLPTPIYSQKIQSAREEGSSMRHRSEIIRETARFFLGHKYWWSSADYTRISELVVQQFPDLKDDSSGDSMTSYRRIQRDLSMCARNLRRSKKPRKMRELSTDPSNTLLNVAETPRTSKKQTKPPRSSMFPSSLEKRHKRPPGSLVPSSKVKKIKQEIPTPVAPEPPVPGVSEDMSAAAALLQQQFMQSSSTSSYHPSAHLHTPSHLLPSLHTHPALHDQQMQISSTLLQQQQHPLQDGHIGVEEAHVAKRLVKEESNIHDAVDHSFTGVKSSVVTPMQRSVSPTVDGNQSTLSKPGQGHIRGMEGPIMNKEDQEKIIQAQEPAPISMKVYADPDHGNDLQERFSTLWRKGKFFDASLGVTNKKLHVHKLVLLAMSPYLQETFKNADPRSQLEVNLPSDTTYETAKAFLKYIYEGVLEVDTSSVRSLHKIATMLQMTKLAQYCQNFAQQLQEEAEQVGGMGGAGNGEIPKISVNLGDQPTEAHVQRQRQLEAQALHRLGDASTMSSSDLHRTSGTRYISEEHSQLKGEYLSTGDQSSTDQMGGTPHFLHQDVLAQHRALVAASSSLQSSNPSSHLLSSSQDVATQQLIQAALARHQATSSPQPSASSSMYQQHHQHMVAQSDANAALLHRLTSSDSSVTSASVNSLDHQQRLALAAYWQAHTIGELMSRGQVTGLTSDPSGLTSASEMAAIAAAAAVSNTEETHDLLSNVGHEAKLKSHSRGHHSKQSTWSSQVGLADSNQQATMLPETCLPGDMTRTHLNSSGGNS